MAGDFPAIVDWGDGNHLGRHGHGIQRVVRGQRQPHLCVCRAGHDHGDGGGIPHTAPPIRSASAPPPSGWDVKKSLTTATERVALTVEHGGCPASPTAIAADPAGGFTATIDWGDGTTSAGTHRRGRTDRSRSSGGAHTYADEGNFTVSATLDPHLGRDRRSPASATSPSSTHDVLAAARARRSPAMPGQALTNVTVATFTDTDTGRAGKRFHRDDRLGRRHDLGGHDRGITARSRSLGSGHAYANAGQDTYHGDGDGPRTRHRHHERDRYGEHRTCRPGGVEFGHRTGGAGAEHGGRRLYRRQSGRSAGRLRRDHQLGRRDDFGGQHRGIERIILGRRRPHLRRRRQLRAERDHHPHLGQYDHHGDRKCSRRRTRCTGRTGYHADRRCGAAARQRYRRNVHRH